MSKKSRLRAQKAKQLEQLRRLEIEEREEREMAKNGSQSKSAKKYMKSARRKEPKVYLILKLLMLIPYAVNGLFFGCVTILAVLFVGINDIGNSMAYKLMIALAAMTVGIVFEFLRKYILGFVFSGFGSGLFFGVGVSFVRKIQYYMETRYVAPENAKMDIKYMLQFYPIGLIAVFSFALLAISVAEKMIKRKREKDRYNNQPVKSIID